MVRIIESNVTHHDIRLTLLHQAPNLLEGYWRQVADDKPDRTCLANDDILVANWLVCLAVFMAVSSREIVSKIISIWWPIMCFVGLGMDHVIANMFLIPIGIFNGAPISVGYYIWKSMIPALIGNTIGGGFFVGVVYW